VTAKPPPAPEPPRDKHTTSAYGAAQISPAEFRPHAPGGVITQTAGVNPDPPADRQAAPDISPTVPYTGDSPTGYDPYTMGTF
jgi:hypothetical protein